MTRFVALRRVSFIAVSSIVIASLGAVVGQVPPISAVAPISTAVPKPSVDPNAPDFKALQTTASREGSVRVIVSLREAGRAGSAKTALARTSDPARIAALQRSVEESIEGTGARVTASYTTLPFLALDATPAALDLLARSDTVARVRPDRLNRLADANTTPLVGANTATTNGYSGAGSTIAVLDTGVDSAHPFLGGRVVSEACFALLVTGPGTYTGDCSGTNLSSGGPGTATPCDLRYPGCWHGTHVAGIASGVSGAGAAGDGISPGASIMAIRVFSRINDTGICGGPATCIGAYDSSILGGLQHVIAQPSGVAAVNLSLGHLDTSLTTPAACDADSPEIKLAIDQLRALNIATVAATGNDANSSVMATPACISSAVSVGAVGNGTASSSADSVASYSNSGSNLMLLAPGGVSGVGRGITSSVPLDSNVDGAIDGHGYLETEGTSMATPHVAGAFAVMRQRFPGATVNDIVTQLRGTGIPITDERNGVTTPRIHIWNAMQAGLSAPPTGLRAVAADGSATLSWTPGNNGGGNISEFAVTTSPGGATTTVPGTANAASITGLTNGTRYSFTVTARNVAGTSVASSASNAVTATANPDGYWIVNDIGHVFNFGTAKPFPNALGIPITNPIVGAAANPSGGGLWVVARDGGVFSYGDATFYGSTGAMKLNQPIVGMASTPTGAGYWLVASDGGIFAYGNATFYGSTGAMKLNQPIVGMASTPTGAGYWLVASDGGIFAYGDATFYGSTGAMKLNQPIVGMASTPTGAGYWLVASDGGIFAYGDATFYGSTGAMKLNQPITAISATASGAGYSFVARDGGYFPYGDATFLGSATGKSLWSIVAIAR